jgi:hypothetical protein
MTDPSPGPRHAEVARRQHTKLTATTRTRISRLGLKILDDLNEGRVSVELADAILMAAGTLVRESAALDARSGGAGDAAQIARTAAESILECIDAHEAGNDPAERALDALAAAGELLAAFVALVVRAEEAAA